ncbi:gamma-tubulin complex component 5 [Atheta coriaria]|uniref:gamma-tubulin complex component 5 n=1 Tax=Dalotia coriaria TaxID=877792 RepID=UPI0031F479A1
MAYKYDPTIEPNIKALIVKLTNFNENTEIFKYVHDYFWKSLRRTDSAFCTTKHEIDSKVDGLAEKLVFHGYLKESHSLNTLYEKYMSASAGEDDTKSRMAVMQLLFAMSKSPTTYLASLPEGFVLHEETKEEDIDWGSYLMEGIDTWSPNFDDSDELSDDELSDKSNEVMTETSLSRTLTDDHKLTKISAENPKKSNLETFESCQRILKENIQHKWYASNVIRDLPEVRESESDIAIRWERYLSQVSYGLLGGRRTKILSEYKVLREVCWQLISPHNSVVFSWSGNNLIVNEDVSISSVRPFVFKNLVSAFLPDILMLHELRTFHRRVLNDEQAPHTYRGYAEAAMAIVRPAIRRLAEIEAEMIKQETILTLISFGNDLKDIMKEVKYLHRVHSAAILNYSIEPRHTCCMNLLTTLYSHLNLTCEKWQMDIILSLYLESAYKYVRIIEEWFRTDKLVDSRREFPLAPHTMVDDDDIDDDREYHDLSVISKKAAFDRAKYILRQSNHHHSKLVDDPLISVIKSEVLQIGRQLRLFSLLGKLHLLHATNFSIYNEWRSEIFDIIRNYSGICNPEEIAEEVSGIDEGIDLDENKMADGAMHIEEKYSTEFDLLENCTDTSDGLLMAAFHDVFYPDETALSNNKVKIKSTYAQLQEMGKHSLPGVQIFIADILGDIIRRKYRNCGQVLKDLFLRDYHLAEHLAIMAKVFLFADDTIYPFYRAVFAKIESNATWGNDIWLTYDLQDVLADAHPRLHERVRVGVKPGWASMLEDPLRTCTLIDVQYSVEWPIDIIVTERCAKMYREMFYFVLKIKWALHTLNHLRYSRSEQRRRQKAPRYVRELLQRLEVMRFGFINVFAALQHYILGYVYRVCRRRFDREFDAATDLETLVRSHEDFVYGFHRLVSRVRDYQSQSFGFDRALYSVRQLRKMWISPGDIFNKMLEKTGDSLRECHRNIFEVISVQVYD